MAMTNAERQRRYRELKKMSPKKCSAHPCLKPMLATITMVIYCPVCKKVLDEPKGKKK